MKLIFILLFHLIAVYTVDALPPVMTMDKKVDVLNERTNTNQYQLASITCTDPDGDLTRVFVKNVNPPRCATCFEVLDCLPQECLQYRAGVGTLNYASAQTYIITLECNDNKGESVTNIFQLDIVPNMLPYFKPPDKYALRPMSGKSPAGTLVYAAGAQDDDPLDTLTYSMTVEPATSASNYQINPQTGDITTTVDMRTECRNDVTFKVSVSDGLSTNGPLVISMPIQNPNVAPVGLNLDTVAMIPEDTAAGGVAYAMEFVDGNKDTVTYTYTASNPAATAQFNINGKNPKITVGGALDFENAAMRQTDLVVTATDGFCSSPPYSLRLQVTDVDEPPVITPITSKLQICEGMGEFDPGYIATDPDAQDTVRWSLVSVSPATPSRFGINPSTGAIIRLVEYDVDADSDRPDRKSPMPANVKFVVRAMDKAGPPGSKTSTATATVSVTFLDCNDNNPVINEPAYEYSVTECTAGGTRLPALAAKDKDQGRNQDNVVYFEGSGGSVYVGTGGEIIIGQALPAGTVVTFNVYAWDRGDNPRPLRSVNPAVVSVVFTPCPTPPPPTPAPPATTPTTTTTTTTTTIPTTKSTTARSFTKTPDDPNLPWIIVAALLGALFLGLLTYMLWRYGSLCWDACGKLNCDQSCRGRPARAPKVTERPDPVVRREPMKLERPPSSTPSEEPPKEKEPNGPGFLFAFWKEHYKEKGLDKNVEHNKKPEPGDMTDYYPHTYDPADPPPGAEPNSTQSSAASAEKKGCSIQ